jgi:ABC-type transporter Mla subunit MlaD
MDREQLFQNLNELEKQLRGIKSATEQVNSVVAANRTVIETLKGYTAQTQKVLDSVRSVYDGDVKEIKTVAEKALTQSSQDFAKKVDAVASDLVDSAAMLQTMVQNELTPLVKNDLVGIIDSKMKPFVLKEMPQSFYKLMTDYESVLQEEKKELLDLIRSVQENSDKAAKELKKAAKDAVDAQAKNAAAVAGFKDKVEGMMKAQTETRKKIDSVANSVKDMGDKAKGSFQKVESAIASTVATLDNMQTLLTSATESIDSALEEIKSSVNTSLTGISKDVNAIWLSVKSMKQIEESVANMGNEITELKEKADRNRTMNIFIIVLLVLGLILQLAFR